MLFKSSARRRATTASTDIYEYVNEDDIDDDIKCTICIQPWQSPVSLDCQHTFCEVCIDKWIRTEASCPVCRQQCRANSVPRKITDTTICNQLDSLPVRCLRCKKTGIPRSRFANHFQRCSKGRMTMLSGWVPKRWSWKKKSTQPKPTYSETTNVNTPHVLPDAYHRPQPPATNTYTRQSAERILSRSAILDARRERTSSVNPQVKLLSNVFIFILIGIGLIVFRQLILFLFCLVAVVILLLCLFLFLILGQ